MEIKLKTDSFFGARRKEVKSRIDDLIIKEDLLDPEKEKVNVYFKGKDSSGILTFSRNEIESLYLSLKSRLNLIKKSKKIINK